MVGVNGQQSAKLLALTLIEESMYFSVTPLPDDVWRFECRPFEEKRLRSARDVSAHDYRFTPDG